MILSEVDQQAIQEAVRKAELRTSGEIVPFVVARSSSYLIAFWKAAGIFGMAALVFILLMSTVYTGWGFGWMLTPPGIVVIVTVSALLGVLLVRFIPGLQRLIAGRAALIEGVRNRAFQAFISEEIFNTRERTGILLFISIFERRVEVIGDSGINAHVKQEDWSSVVADVISGIRAGKLGDGLVSAIDRCGGLLEDKGVEIRPDDTNELSDSVRFED